MIHGFITGDLCKLVVTKGKYIGTYIGRVTVGESGTFVLTTKDGKKVDSNYKNFTLLQCNNYSYSQ